MDYTALKDEIENDPQGMGYSAHLPGDHVSVAQLLSDPDPAEKVIYERLTSEKATRIAAEVGATAPILADSKNASSSTQSMSLAAMNTLGKAGVNFALNLQSVRDMLQALKDNGVLTSKQKAAFIGESKRTARREEAVLGKGTTVSAQDVTKALQ